MDKLGFVKTVEAILAALVSISIFNFIQSQNINRANAINRAPTQELNDILNVINLNEIVTAYDYLELNSFFSRVFFETINYYFEPIYYDKLTISGDHNKTWPVISFTYEFPTGVDKNSIKLLTDDYELSTKAVFNWYYMPVSFNEQIIDDYVQINISVRDLDVNNNSFKAFVRDYESIVSVDNWASVPNESNTSLIVYVPELNTNELVYVYFSDNSTNYSINYPNLSITNYATPVISTLSESRMCEVITQLEGISTTPASYYLKYSLFTNEKDSYENLNLVNNTGVVIDYENKLRQGRTPLIISAKGSHSVKRIIPTTNGFVELRVYGDYI